MVLYFWRSHIKATGNRAVICTWEVQVGGFFIAEFKGNHQRAEKFVAWEYHRNQVVVILVGGVIVFYLFLIISSRKKKNKDAEEKTTSSDSLYQLLEW